MLNPLDDHRFDHELLKRYRFDVGTFERQVEGIRDGSITGEESYVRGRIEPVARIPELSYDPATESYRSALAAGAAALSSGKVAMLVLNGGLATRFGGAVKGIVEVFDNKSFLACKIEDARRAASVWGSRLPIVLLNSFSTSAPTQNHLEENDHFGMDPADVLSMDQTISVRLEPTGEPFFGNDSQPRYYAPGHGEFFRVLEASGMWQALVARGIEWITFSNVDNLGATIDPVVVGHHILAGVDMTVEVTEKRKNSSGRYDVGGAPALVDGDLQVVEGFRFPASVNQEELRDFQTNNMVFSLRGIQSPLELQRHLVRKVVDDRPSLAFEAITCEASGARRLDGSPWLRLGLLRVPRDGRFGRFFPVKSRQDLEELRDTLRDRLQSGWHYWQIAR